MCYEAAILGLTSTEHRVYFWINMYMTAMLIRLEMVSRCKTISKYTKGRRGKETTVDVFLRKYKASSLFELTSRIRESI